MVRLRKQHLLSSFVIPLLLVLSACSAGEEDTTPDPEVTTLIYAQISENGVDREWLDRFNREHEGEVQIEVRDYSPASEHGEQGINLLMTEIAAGRIPDIIELGTSGETTELPYRKLAKKGFLEDLWPYIENDPGLGRVGIIEGPLKAAEIDGGLYTVFERCYLHTLTGAKAVVGDRTGWTVEDLLEAFETMPEGSVILETYEDYSVQQHLLASFLYGFSDLFIDYENGQCYFDGELFRSILDLVKRVPDEPWWHPYYKQKDRKNEYRDRQMDGLVMLDDTGFTSILDFWFADLYFGGTTCIGYPVGDGSPGVYLEPSGIRLAMSSTCTDKDAAWQYIRWLITPKAREEAWGFPVNKKLFNRARAQMLYGHYIGIPSENIPFIFYDPLTKEELAYLTSLFDTSRSSILLDKEVRDIVLDTAGAYFAGDRDLEQTLQLLNSRVELYLNEQT